MDLNEIHERLGSAETPKDYLKLYSDLFKFLSKKPREDNGAFLSISPLVSKALTDLNVQDAELQQRILLSLGLLLCKNNSVELPMSLKQQTMQDVVNLLMVTSDKSVTFRCYWCLSQLLDAGIEMQEPMALHVLKSIESVQASSMRNVTLYGEACGLLQKLIEKNSDELFKHVKLLAKLVFTSVFHPVSKIREISSKNLQLVTPILQSGNDSSSVPVGAVVLDLVKKMLDDMLHLFRNKNEIYVLEVWNVVVNILGQSLHKNVNAINGLLSVVEKGFKHESQDVKLKSFDAWKTLISNFALSEEVICIPKKLRLLLQPLLRISSTKTEAVIQAKCDTWWHIAWSLGDKVPNHFELVCLPLLEFVCGTSLKDNGEVAVLQQTTVYSSSQQKIMRQKGCEILIRFLEQPLSGTFLHSPKKTPTISIPPLKKPVAAVIFPKFPKEFVKSTGAVIREFGKEPQMLSHIDYLLKLILFAISNTPHDASKDYIDAVTSFVQLVVDIVKCQLCPPLLCSKLVDKVSQLPKKMLTAHYYYVGSTGVMHGNLYLTILSLLLHPTLLTVPDFKQRVVPLFQKLAGSSIKSSLSPLSYAHSVILFMKEQTVINNCDAEVLLNLWSAVSSALFAAVQETLEVSGGSSFEQDFSCMYDVLTYPFEYVLMLNTSQGQFRTILAKSWGDLYKLFYRCSALLPSTDNNSACDGICSQLLKCLNKDNMENSSICEVLSHIMPIIVECVDFEAIGKNSGKGGFSAERWGKSKHNPLGNIAPLIDVVKWFLTYFHESVSVELSSKDKDAQQSTIKFAVMYIEILNTFISKITSSKALSAVLDELAEPLSKVYDFSRKKNIGTKKNVHNFLTQLEVLWKTITTNIQVHYTAQYDSDFLQVLSPLLEVNLRHHKQEIKDRTRQFWFASFAPNHSKLDYPASLKEVLKKLRPPLLPGSDTSPIEEDSPFTDFTEDQTFILPPPKENEPPTPPVAKLSFSLGSSPAQNTRKINENNSPSGKTRTPSKAKPDKVSIDDLPKEEFVEIKSPASTKKILTRRQKEAMKKKSYVPALYSELSQNSCSMDYSLDTQDSCSVVSLSQDEHEISVIGQFQDSVEVKEKQIQAGEKESPATVHALKEKEIASSSACGSDEKEKLEKSGNIHVIEPVEPVVHPLEQAAASTEPYKDVPNCSVVSPEVQVMEIEIIDVVSQSDTDSGENVSEQVNMETETRDNKSGGEVHHETAKPLNANSIAKGSESVTADLQNHSLQQGTDAAAHEKNSEVKGSELCNNIRMNTSALPENKQSENEEFSSSLPQENDSEDVIDVADSEEIIPSSQSSSEGDHDISKDSSLLYRFRNMQKTSVNVPSPVPHVVFCSKPICDSRVVTSEGADKAAAKATTASLTGKNILGDKHSGSPVVVSVGKVINTIVENTETSGKFDVTPDDKENGNSSMTETVILGSLPNGYREEIGGVSEETKMKGTAAVSLSEMCDNDVNVLDSLSKEGAKKKLCMELQDDVPCSGISLPSSEGKSNTIDGHCSDSLPKVKKHVKVDKNIEKSSSPKKAANKTHFSENIHKGKGQNSPIIITVASESCYVKTRRQVFQHSPLVTRSRLKSSNVTSDVFNISNSSRKKGSKKGVSVRSPKKNAEGTAALNSFSEPRKLVSENSGDISVPLVTGVEERLSVSEEPEECEAEDTQNFDSNPETENSGVRTPEESTKSASSVDIENNESEIHTKVIVDEPENLSEVKCGDDGNSSTKNLNQEIEHICGADGGIATSALVSDANKEELTEAKQLPDNNDTLGDFAVKIPPFVEEQELVSCKVIDKDDNSVKSELSQLTTEVSEHLDKSFSDRNTVINETQNLVSDKAEPSPDCENVGKEFSIDEQDSMCLEKDDQIKAAKSVSEQSIKLSSDCVGVDENGTVNETAFQSVDLEKSESDDSVPKKASEVPVPLSVSEVMNSKITITNEINPDSNKSVQVCEDTSDSSESTVSYKLLDEQIHNNNSAGNNCVATLNAPSAEQVVCLEVERQSDKICTRQEKGTVACEDSSSDANPTAPNEMNDSLASHKVSVVNSLMQKSDEAVKETEIQVDNLQRHVVDKEMPAVCTEMVLTDDQKDFCERTESSQNDLNKEKVSDDSNSTHKDVTLEHPQSGDNEATENDQAKDSIQDGAIQSSPKLNGVKGSGSPSKKTDNQHIFAIPAASISYMIDVKLETPSISPFVSNLNCDNELSLSPCSGAKKRKQKIPSNTCAAIDIKRKKLELRSKRDASEKLGSPKQMCSENAGLERLTSPAKHSKAESTSISSKTGIYNESNDSTKSVPEKFMQLWHSSIVMDSDANVTIQEKKQKLPPEKLKNSSSNSKSNHSDFEVDKNVGEEVRTEETSSSSILRDVRNSPLQWRGPSSSVISITVSPLSRSQRMVRAARKHMNSPDTAKQNTYSRVPRTTLLESPSTSKAPPSMSENSKVSSPVYSSILKKRTHESSSTSSPPVKKRKVSFADPLVQGEMIIEPCDNENSCRARRSAKRCLQMNRDNSLRSKRKIFWCSQDQEKYPSLKKSQRFSNNDVGKMPIENSGTTFDSGHFQEKLEVTEIKKPEEKIKVKGEINGTRSEQNNVILDKVNESVCPPPPPPVAFSASQLSPTSSLTSSDIPSSDVYQNSEDFNCDSQAIVFEELVDCTEPVNSVIPLLTSPMWVRGLSQLLLSRKINTIGDLSGLTVEKLKALPIRSPKLETVQNILKEYVLQRLKSSSCKLSTASPSSPLSCGSSGEKTDVIQTSADCQEDISASVDQPAIPSEPGENSETVVEMDSSDVQVEPCEISEPSGESDSQGELHEEHDKEKCREMIAKLCSSQVIHEMPLVLLCDLLMKITNGIKAKSCQKPQEEEK